MKGWILVGLLALLSGCATPPPPRVAVPAPGSRGTVYETEQEKPLPPSSYDPELAPGYDDAPLITQRPPEQRAYIEAYDRVGKPRVTVFVNRTLEGQIIPVNSDEPIASVEHVRRSTTGVSVEHSDAYSRESRWRDEQRERVERFESTGPAEYRESVEVYLRPGEYDEVTAKSLDYEAMENILTDWIAANGEVALVSPTLARRELTDKQIEDLQKGRPQVLREVAQQLDADILIQVQAHPTRQTLEGLEVRVLAEAINVRGGESIARAAVDIPPPLDKRQINKYTRFLARKLMNDMTDSWMSMALAREQMPPTTKP